MTVPTEDVRRATDRLVRVGLTVCATALVCGPITAVVVVTHSAGGLLLLALVLAAALARCLWLAGDGTGRVVTERVTTRPVSLVNRPVRPADETTP